VVSNNPLANIFSADFGYSSGPNTSYGNGGSQGNSLGGWNMNSLFNMGGSSSSGSGMPYGNFDPFSVMGFNSSYGSNYQSSDSSFGGFGGSGSGNSNFFDPGTYTSSILNGSESAGMSQYQSYNAQYSVGPLLSSIGMEGIGGMSPPSMGNYVPTPSGGSPSGSPTGYPPPAGSPPVTGSSPTGSPPSGSPPPAGSPPAGSPPSGSPPPASSPPSGPNTPLFSGGKEGLGIGDTSSNGDGSNLAGTKASWYYDWSPYKSDKVNDPNAQFIPMIWGSKDMNPDALKAAKESSSQMLLTFNEPDHPGQASMSVDEALSHWDQLEATGKKLSSPAVTNGPEGVKWLDEFMQKAQAQGKQVDSISLHWYGSSGSSTQQNLDAMKAHIDQVHQKYPDKPINLTEFGIDASGLTANKDQAFLDGAEKMLNGMDYVQMYAPYGTGDIHGNK